MKPKICNDCQGTGHHRKTAPVIKTKVVRTAIATTKRVYITKSLGYGCLECLGLGITNPECRS